MILNNFNTEAMFEYENGFYATSTEARFGKFIAHYELYKRIVTLPGVIVECGLFKGNSFFRLAHFRDLLESRYSRKLIGFDIFGAFPDTDFEDDKKYLQKNRDVDKANLTSIVVMLNTTKQTVFKNWKFKDLNGSDVYADLSIVDMLTMANIMQTQTTNTLIAESKLIKKLETLTVEELKVFDARKEFETIVGA